MHIAEGVLSAPVLLTGAAVTAVAVPFGLRRIATDRLMLAGLLGAAFFVASLIHVPVGFSSSHLILNGLLGMLLGASAFPVIFVALLLQAVLFQFGGFTVLGVNAATMGAGAWAAAGLFQLLGGQRRLKLAAFVAGFSGVFISGLLTALALWCSGEGFRNAAWALFMTNCPIMIVEGFITVFAAIFLNRVFPNLFTSGSLK